MDREKNMMANRPVFPLLMSMALPVMLSMFIQALYNIVDSMWVARLGTEAITAVSLAFPLQNISMSLGVGMGVGVGSVISMSIGAGDQETANKAASVGVALSVIHSIVFALAGLIITKPFLRMFTNDPDTLKWACDYTYIVMCVSFGQLISMCMEKIFQGLGKMKTTMFLMASGCIINIILDPILIFGWFGFPRMGVKGAAVATVAGQIGGLILYVAVCLKKNIGVAIHPHYMKPDSSMARRIYSIGIPSSLMLAMPSLMVGILNGILGRLDQVYVAVFGLYFKLQTFVNMPANGVVQGMRPIISFNYGAGLYGRVRQCISYSMKTVGVIMVIGTLCAVGIPSQILGIFNAEGPLLEYGIQAFRMIGMCFVFSTAGIVGAGVFEALGRGRDSLFISLLRQFIIILPCGWALSYIIGAPGIWVLFPVAEAVASFVAWKKIKKVFSEK